MGFNDKKLFFLVKKTVDRYHEKNTYAGNCVHNYDFFDINEPNISDKLKKQYEENKVGTAFMAEMVELVKKSDQNEIDNRIRIENEEKKDSDKRKKPFKKGEKLCIQIN